MADILKITSPISIHRKIENIPKQLSAKEVFDVNHSGVANRKIGVERQDEQEKKQALLHELNRQLFAPLLNQTNAQAETLRKLIEMAMLLRTSFGNTDNQLPDAIFTRPQDLLGELLRKEEGATVFKGEFFDTLRILAKLEGQPRVKEAVLSILKHFDCYTHQDQALRRIIGQSRDLAGKVFKEDGALLRQAAEHPESLDRQQGGSPKEICDYLKNELMPLLGSLVKGYQVSARVRDPVMAIVHHVIRYDKADDDQLKTAMSTLGNEMKSLAGLKDDEIALMKQQLMSVAREAREKNGQAGLEKGTIAQFGIESEEEDLPRFLSRTLESDMPPKLAGLAQNLLMQMVQNESPLFPFMHFLVPLRFLGENTYGEFFVDKDCQERKGDAQSARNIFFTIQSELYGNFEVDLLERDKKISLDIRCPETLVASLKDLRSHIREIIAGQGYRLDGLEINVYETSQSILHRFPKLARRKVGFDVKI